MSSRLHQPKLTTELQHSQYYNTYIHVGLQDDLHDKGIDPLHFRFTTHLPGDLAGPEGALPKTTLVSSETRSTPERVCQK